MKIIYISKKFKYICLVTSTLVITFFVGNFLLGNTNKNVITTSVCLEDKLIKNSSESDKKIAYLTFDDGPTAKETEKILEILKEEDVKATFFVVGKHVKEHPELVKRAYEEGHYIANHGYSHNNKKLYSSSENFEQEIVNTDIEIGKAIGVPNYCSHIFRFPNGYKSNIFKWQKKWAVKKLEELNYFYVDWNCLNKDSEVKTSNAKLLKNLKSTCKNKSQLIVLMHDTGDVNRSSEVLRESIRYLKQEGYEFRSMSIGTSLFDTQNKNVNGDVLF